MAVSHTYTSVVPPHSPHNTHLRQRRHQCMQHTRDSIPQRSGPQRHRDTETQRHRDTKTLRH
eukprot:3936538-Rhodomonas_salina.1